MFTMKFATAECGSRSQILVKLGQMKQLQTAGSDEQFAFTVYLQVNTQTCIGMFRMALLPFERYFV